VIVSLTILAYIAPSTPQGSSHIKDKVNISLVNAATMESIAKPTKRFLAVKRFNVVYENMEEGIIIRDNVNSVIPAFEKNGKGYCINSNPVKMAKIEPIPPKM
jgi:hypothetical protein